MLLLGRGRRLKLKKFPLGGAGLHIGEAVYIYVDARAHPWHLCAV